MAEIRKATKKVACPECGKRLAVPVEQIGRRIKCPACLHHIIAGAPPAPGSIPDPNEQDEALAAFSEPIHLTVEEKKLWTRMHLLWKLRLSPHAFVVLNALFVQSNQQDVCEAKLNEIADQTRMSPRSVSRQVRELSRRGLIRVNKLIFKNRVVGQAYALNWPAIESDASKLAIDFAAIKSTMEA